MKSLMKKTALVVGVTLMPPAAALAHPADATEPPAVTDASFEMSETFQMSQTSEDRTAGITAVIDQESCPGLTSALLDATRSYRMVKVEGVMDDLEACLTDKIDLLEEDATYQENLELLLTDYDSKESKRQTRELTTKQFRMFEAFFDNIHEYSVPVLLEGTFAGEAFTFVGIYDEDGLDEFLGFSSGGLRPVLHSRYVHFTKTARGMEPTIGAYSLRDGADISRARARRVSDWLRPAVEFTRATILSARLRGVDGPGRSAVFRSVLEMLGGHDHPFWYAALTCAGASDAEPGSSRELHSIMEMLERFAASLGHRSDNFEDELHARVMEYGPRL